MGARANDGFDDELEEINDDNYINYNDYTGINRWKISWRYACRRLTVKTGMVNMHGPNNKETSLWQRQKPWP